MVPRDSAWKVWLEPLRKRQSCRWGSWVEDGSLSTTRKEKAVSWSHLGESRAEPRGRRQPLGVSGFGVPGSAMPRLPRALQMRAPTNPQPLLQSTMNGGCATWNWILTNAHCLSFFLYQKIFSSYPTRGKDALPELAQLISDTVPLTQLSWGVSVISLHCHWVLELHLPCKGTLKVKVKEKC